MIYNSENSKIAVVLSEMGMKEESENYFKVFKEYAENDNSVYKHINLAMYYSYHGEPKKAIEHLELFSKQNNYHYWSVIFTEIDPLVDNIKDLPEFKEIHSKIETKFWNYHQQIKAMLEENGLLLF